MRGKRMIDMYYKISMRIRFNVIVNAIVIIGLLMVMVSSNMILSTEVEKVVVNKSIDEAVQMARHLGTLLEKEASTAEIQKFTEETVSTNNHVAYSVFIDKNVEAIAHSDVEKIGTVYQDEYTISGVTEEKVQTSKFFAEVQDKWTYDIMVPVSVKGKVIGAYDIGVYIEEVTSILNSIKRLQRGQLLVFIIVLSAVVALVCKKLFTPLGVVRDICEKIQNCDLSITLVDELVRREDEIGAIGRALEALKNKIAEIMHAIGIEVEEIEHVTYQLQGGTEIAMTSSVKMEAEIQDVVKGSEEQSSYVATGAAITKEICLGIEQINQSIESVTSTTGDTVAKAQEGYKVLGDTIKEIQVANETLEVVTKQMNVLDKHSEQVQDITAMISGLARQTNLLALNAAIEAARSGEYGKGFSVVADEVKVLAEQSSEAAQKIEAIISEIQNEIKKAVVQIGVSTEYVKNSTDAAHKAGVSFESILADISRISEEMQEISSATEEVNAGSQHMLEDLSNTMKITSKLVHNIENIEKGAMIQEEHMRDVLKITDNLGKMVTVLKDVLEEFKTK